MSNGNHLLRLAMSRAVHGAGRDLRDKMLRDLAMETLPESSIGNGDVYPPMPQFSLLRMSFVPLSIVNVDANRSDLGVSVLIEGDLIFEKSPVYWLAEVSRDMDPD